MSKDLYIIRKLVMAESAEEAIKKEKKQKVSDVWIDEEWKNNKIQNNKIKGFK